MKKLYYILFLVFASCKSLTMNQSLQGEYYKKGKDYEYSLKLDKDRTFVLSKKYQDASPACEGKWTHIAKDTILLKCNPIEDINKTLSNGYMQERENKVIVVNQKKLKLGQVTLKRVNN